MGAMSRYFRWLRFMQGALVPLAVLALWQWLAVSGLVNPLILPTPVAVFKKWIQYLSPFEPFDAAK